MLSSALNSSTPHLRAQVHRLIAPAPDDAAAVAAYLHSHGLAAKPLSPNGDLLQVQS